MNSVANMADRRPSFLGEWVRHANLRRIRHRQSSADGSAPSVGLLHAVTVYAATEFVMVSKWRLLGLPARGSVFTSDRFELLDAAIESAPSTGLWLEFGVYRGESINHIAQRTGKPIFGFDSFEGLPQFWKPLASARAFSTDGALPEVRDGVSLIKGWFDQTLPPFLHTRPEDRVAFLHVDCDLYSSTRTVLTNLGPRIAQGTVVVFDEFCDLMPDDEERAWREFCRKEGISFSWLGCSLDGSVALKVTSRAPQSGDGNASPS